MRRATSTARAKSLNAPGGSLSARFAAVRTFSAKLCEPLEVEDYVVQSMEPVSPTRWHLAHTTWFFEAFVLAKWDPTYRSPHPQFNFLFNSYYDALGAQFEQGRRGVLSRPTVAEIYDYRASVDAAVTALLERREPADDPELTAVLEVGLQHEQQHQELILTDIKHVFAQNPLVPVYAKQNAIAPAAKHTRLRWADYAEGLREFGHAADGFCYDNELPRHKAFVHAFELGARLITNGEYLDFMADSAYQRPELWLSDGWLAVQDHGWDSPLYWQRGDDGWQRFTLAGLRPLNPHTPVAHVSFYEADAFARWAGARLPTELEWETAAAQRPVAGNFVESECYEPCPLAAPPRDNEPRQLFGDVWEWTASPYVAYPGYAPPGGAIGEYNGKFMSGQMVLRGGSCATSQAHLRATYRNFWAPATRWQFTGIRLAR
jgi:ergothioneine biosynthesis protein EgtB